MNLHFFCLKLCLKHLNLTIPKTSQGSITKQLQKQAKKIYRDENLSRIHGTCSSLVGMRVALPAEYNKRSCNWSKKSGITCFKSVKIA